MKVLFVHNFYRELGGEDVSVSAEVELLMNRGHHVLRYVRSSAEVEQSPAWKVAAEAVWNPRTYHDLRALLRDEKPTLIHCTNTFPLISPSVYSAAADAGVPVVQALRNYRWMCANACFVRTGSPCELCLKKPLAWRSILKSCYRSSAAASAVFVAQQAALRWAAPSVSRYYTLTRFARAKFVAAGIPEDRLDIKPNFIDPDPGVGSHAGGYVLFAGRLSPEKGIRILLDAWKLIGNRALLKVVGDGSDRALVEAAVAAGARIEYLGPRSPTEVLDLAGGASCVVLSSIVYETFGRIIIEAYSRGTPVVVTRLGAMAELVEEGVTGLCFEPGNAADLAECVLRLHGDEALRRDMGERAREKFEQRYTADANYDQLMGIYQRALRADQSADAESRPQVQPTLGEGVVAGPPKA